MADEITRDEIDAILNRIVSGEFTQRDIDLLRDEFKRLYRLADIEADEDRLLSNLLRLDFTRPDDAEWTP